MKDLRYLTFEVNMDCNLAKLHPRCPVSDPERFMFGRTDVVLTDEMILAFWRWCVAENGFRGIVLWHLYNEPTMALVRINRLQEQMRSEHPQRFHLWTNAPNAVRLSSFDHVQLTDYRVVRPDDLDNRRASTTGEGKLYAQSPPSGVCGRGYGWEVIIDFHANWLLCCNDWRAEESVGNLHGGSWDCLLENFKYRADIRWSDAASYASLPRMCRACMDVNPNLHKSALPPAGVSW